MKPARPTQHPIPTTNHAAKGAQASRIMSQLQAKIDPITGLLLFIAGLYAYTTTLAPTVLDGDAALFQYTPYVLGVTYPTGFPLYILLGKIWLTLFPFGEIAWRMNFFSTFCSAASLPLIYATTRRLLAPTSKKPTGANQTGRWAALVAVLTFATLPTFWRWSTEAKTYPLNILLFAGTLYLLALALERQSHSQNHRPNQNSTTIGHASRITFHVSHITSRLWPNINRTWPLAAPALLLGLQISVHNTAVLLVPGLFLMVWLNFRPYLRRRRVRIAHLLLLIIPGLFYLYIPLRAEWLIARLGRQAAIEHGLLADFYYSGPMGLVRYFTATDFTGGVVTNWGLVPRQFFTDYLPILADNLTPLGAGLGLVGGLGLAILRPRLFWPLFLIYATPIPFVLTYGRGEQAAFLLPSFLVFSIFIGHILTFTNQLLITAPASRVAYYASRFTSPFLFLILISLLFLPQTRYNLNWLDAKWSRAIYNEWADALSHPLEPGAAVLAHWGDLTPFWYMQYAEGRRPDLRGLYPPTEKVVADWYGSGGGGLYIAGPLQGWAPGIETRYQLLPWGRLVRIAPRSADPQTLLPALPHVIEATFTPPEAGESWLRLIGVDFPPRAVGGTDYTVTLTWQALTNLPPETTVSLRLSQGEAIVAQLDDTLLSGWFPGNTLPAGQYLLSYMPVPVPLGTLPGKYRLQLVAYTSYKHPWALANGSTLLDLGEVEIVSPPASRRLEAGHTIPGHDFNGEIELADYGYSVSRVGQGKGFAVKFLWRAITRPVDNYRLLVEAVDANGNIILQAAEHQPAGGRAPTAAWQPGQFVRDQVDLTLPAGTPVGEKALRVRLSWLRPDGSKLKVRRWLLPLGDSLNLDWLAVTEKEGRVFDPPQIQYPLEANLEDKARLLGYNSSIVVESGLESGLRPRFPISRTGCMADPAACQVHFDFYWQGLGQMDVLYFVFLHLVDEQDRIVTQHDRGPGKRGKQPTTGWLPGEVVTDPVDLQLPPDIAPGQYTMRLGMYLPPAGPRLAVLDDRGRAVADFVEIGTIEVTP